MKNILKTTLIFIIAILMTTIFSLTAFAQEEILTSSNSFPPSDQYVEFIPQPPMITMLKENGGLLFTTLLIGIALGIGGTLLVQHIRRKKKQ
ncbi:MAG: hypothetical protein IJ462_02365 [Clostridia bacterium]|nr:hypothetical protein [Clostridia bacterium]